MINYCISSWQTGCEAWPSFEPWFGNCDALKLNPDTAALALTKQQLRDWCWASISSFLDYSWVIYGYIILDLWWLTIILYYYPLLAPINHSGLQLCLFQAFEWLGIRESRLANPPGERVPSSGWRHPVDRRNPCSMEQATLGCDLCGQTWTKH